MMRWTMAGLGAAVVAGGLWWALSGGEGEADAAFITAPLERGDVVRSVAATGRLEALVTVEVGSQLSGQLAEVAVDFDDPVTAGEVIARIDPATFEQRVRQAEADLAVQRASARAAEADIAQAEAQLFEATQEVERVRPLAERAIASDAALDAAEAAFRRAEAGLMSARAQFDVAAARVAQAEASLASAEVDLERTYIRSPVDGVVVGRDVDPGQTVAASLQAPVLFTIAQDLSLMRVEISVDEADIGEIRPGLPIEFTVDAYPERVFAGAVDQVRKQPAIEQNVVTYTVTADAANGDRALLPGMTANVEIILEERRDVLRVANGALRFSPPAEARLAEAGGGAE
ncbi:MAG: efflux RND transporter periplasmic adaptor subunit, partial [Caulobacterales bacterium]|nr:efflux RND transporter periplasmic adaptor subunit [Caulobacterales bacterium]